MMAEVAPATLMWFLPLSVPIAVWVAWSDMKFMKIPNNAVLALGAVWVVAGPLVVPLSVWAWGLGLGAVVLVIGFLLTAGGLVGAGDSKFAAAMAPFFVAADPALVMALFAACLLGAFAAHRGMGRLPAFRAATADWESWRRRDFPMGLALAGTLIFYPPAAMLMP
jgi:prepilin peptidase CpaA